MCCWAPKPPGGGDRSGLYSSGTSQVPRSAETDMLEWRARGWSIMLNGEMFGIYTAQTGPRGRDKIFSTNWLMAMAGRKLGPGTLTLRSMLSLEPATITSRRYPLLFTTGETAFGVPIINGQHPHDFFMELAAIYQIRLSERAALTFYGGRRGEPALGPPAFPHRISASEDPVAVISHHLQDSTHIADKRRHCRPYVWTGDVGSFRIPRARDRRTALGAWRAAPSIRY